MIRYTYTTRRPNYEKQGPGELILAQYPIQVLQLWYLNQLPPAPTHRQYAGDLGTPLTFPTEGFQFISLVIAAIERHYNLSPILFSKELEKQEEELVTFMEENNILVRKDL